MKIARLLNVAVVVFCVCSAGIAQTFTQSVLSPSGSNTKLIQASDGNFYGALSNAGDANGGEIFRVTPAGVYTTLYTFCLKRGNCVDGLNPQSALVEAPDGNFYGTTTSGGTSPHAGSGGTIFRLTPAGVLTTVVNFCMSGGTTCTDGAAPTGLALGSDGVLYGTTLRGGANGGGTFYSLTTAGAFAQIFDFCSSCTAASGPEGTLVEGSAGLFYGTTAGGGTGGYQGAGAGTIFSITKTGGLTTLYSYCPNDTNGTCADFPGAQVGGLVRTADGSLWGLTGLGGVNGQGSVYRYSRAGFSTLYSFCSAGGYYCTDGAVPIDEMTEGPDGNLYGMTEGGGSESGGAGTVFQITQAGALKTMYTFCTQYQCPSGGVPFAGLTNGGDGSLYGSAFYDGANSGGTIYSLTASPALEPVVLLTPSAESVVAGTPFTLSYSVSNGHNAGTQYCFATSTAAASGWSGIQHGTIAVQTAKLTAPATAGTYTYALTCGGGQESGFATVTVTPAAVKVGTTTTMAATPYPAMIGDAVTFTATVKQSSGTRVPTGSVTFKVGSYVLATATLNAAGVATLTESTTGLPADTYGVTASYGGDSGDNSSVAAPVHVVLKNATLTTLTESSSAVTPPTNVTFTATVKRSNTEGTPTGSVTFYYGAVRLTTVNVDANGVAALTVSTNGVPAATYALTAKFNGSAADAGSVSGAASVTVQ